MIRTASTDLPRLLAELYPDTERTYSLLLDARIPPESLDLTGAPSVFWPRVAHDLYRQRLLEDLIAEAIKRYPRREVELSVASEEYQRRFARRVDPLLLQPPGMIRSLLDQYLPRLHSSLTRKGTLSNPPELPELYEYLRSLQATLLQEQRDKIYLPLAGKAAPRDSSDSELDPFRSVVQQSFLQLIGREEGGDSVSAQIASINRRSRTIRNILKAILRAEEPLVLLGEPGSGKTLTLQQAVIALAEAEQRRVFPRIPVYVRLGEFHVETAPADDDVREFVKQQVPDIATRLEALDGAQRLILFFDGMDEMSRAGYTGHTEALSRFAHRRKCLFSCRITDFSPVFIHQRLVLLPFDRHQVLDYLGKYIRVSPIEIDGTEYSRKALAKRIARRDLPVETDNPFVLWLLCLYLESRKAWPSSRVELLGFYTRQNYERKQEELGHTPEALSGFHECEAAWAWLAWTITRRNLGPAIPVSELQSPEWNSEALRAGKICGVLAESHDRQQHLIRFQHHRFQEYFTAVHLSRHPASLDGSVDFDAPRWQETITNLLLMHASHDVVQSLTASLADLASRLEDGLRQEDQSRTREVLAAVSDRVEFASRILRQRVSGSAAFDELAQQVASTVPLVMKHANPIEQVKMIRVCLNVREIDWVPILDKPLHSDVAWVRNQALVLLGSNRAAARHIGSDLATEIAYDLGNLQFSQRVRAYVQAAKASGDRTAWHPVAIGVTAFAAYFVLLFLLAMFAYAGSWKVMTLDTQGRPLVDIDFDKWIYRRAEDWARPLVPEFIAERYKRLEPEAAVDRSRQIRQFSVLGEPASVALSAAATIGAGFVAAARAPTSLWFAMSTTSVVSAALIPSVLSLWAGSGITVWLGWAYLCLWFYFRVIWAGLAYLAHLIILSGYVVATRRDRQAVQSHSHFLKPVWRCGNYGVHWKETASLLKVMCAAVLFVSLGPTVAQWLTDVSGMPFHPVINSLLLLGVPCLIVLIMLLRPKLGGAESLGVVAGVALALIAFLALEFAIMALLSWLASKPVWIQIARGLAVAVLIGLAIYIVRRLDFLRYAIARYRLRRFPANRYTPGEWTSMLKASDPSEQELLLLRTAPRSLGLTTRDYLQFLEEVEPLITHEPARSTYWDQRDRLQEVLRQERV